MNALFKNFLLSISSAEEATPKEAEYLLAEIEVTKTKMTCAWNHLDFAAPDYVEIAVLNLLLAQTQYSLLNKRYRLLLGINQKSSLCLSSAAKSSTCFLESQLLNHAFYGSMFSATAEKLPLDNSPSVSKT